MKTFKQYMREETMPFAGTARGTMEIDNSAVRDNLNSLIANSTNEKFLTPYIGLERVRKALATHHIFVPGGYFLEGDSGMLTFPISQYGEKFGMTNDGEVMTSESSPYSVFFEYRMSDNGMFDVFCEVVDQDELEELLSDVEDELNDEESEEDDEDDLSENYHPSYSSAIQTAVDSAKKRGYEVDSDDYHNKVSTGPRKPSEGKTVSHNIELMKDGKPTKKRLAIQVYNRGGDKTPFELNHYISEEQELSEISRDLASRYIQTARHDGDVKNQDKRSKGINLALLKKWGDKKYGLPEPKVKATSEEVEETPFGKPTDKPTTNAKTPKNAARRLARRAMKQAVQQAKEKANTKNR
jgi:hypothetical protein